MPACVWYSRHVYVATTLGRGEDASSQLARALAAMDAAALRVRAHDRDSKRPGPRPRLQTVYMSCHDMSHVWLGSLDPGLYLRVVDCWNTLLWCIGMLDLPSYACAWWRLPQASLYGGIEA